MSATSVYAVVMWPGPDHPYQDLPALPPAVDVETPGVLKATISASRALAALDQACRRLPDPAMLISIIPILEAQASSEIENIVTTNDELFRAANDVFADLPSPAVKEALRYREALWAGHSSLAHRPLTSQTAIEVCSIVNGRPAMIRNQPGTFIGNPDTHERLYTPPEGREVIAAHLSVWEKFIHGDHGIDPLVVMALQHYQFEAIHPFFDGNGRTGRIINLLYLEQSDLLVSPVLYLSGHIVRTKERYYEALRAVTGNDDWDGWILYMMDVVGETAAWTLQLIESLEGLRSVTGELVRSLLPHAPTHELVQLLFAQPYIRIDNVVSAGLAQRQTASRWLTQLSDADILQRQKVGRSVLFVNEPLLALLGRMTSR